MKIDEAYIYNVSLTNPNDPMRDPMSHVNWKNPLVSLDQAIKATVGPRDLIIGDPTNFKSFLHPKEKDAWVDGDNYDWGWDLEDPNMGI